MLVTIHPIENLNTMDWEEFKHLIAELFSQYFSVNVSMLSKLKDITALRDLYDTMINEGTVKGILVTISHYDGADSYTFSEDKPITLLTGAEIIHLFREFG